MHKYLVSIRDAVRIFSVLLMSLVLSQSAFATLGGDLSSIRADQVHLKASTQIVAARQLYSVQEMRTSSGTQIRQYFSPGGTVFAVTWQGNAPDLEQLLGPYFDQYVSAANAQHSRRGRGVHIDDGDLVIDTAGHMRFVIGRAYLRSKMPQGVTGDEIH